MWPERPWVALRWALLGAVSTLVVLATPWPAAHATPPVVVLAWIDRAGLEAAALPFGIEAQQSFGGALVGLTVRGRCGGNPPAPGFECVEPWGLLRVFPRLVCPAVQAGRIDRVEAFFATLERQRLVRGFISRLQDTAVTFRLVRAGGAWELAEVHRSLSPHPAVESHATHTHLECGVGLPTGVVSIPGATLASPTAVLVDGQDRIWVAHRGGMGVTGRGGVAVHERGAWRDASVGLDGEVEDFHATPSGELFASGRRAGWRWENGAWVRRLSPTPCLSPLRLTSLGDLLFGVCAYYPYYVAWPTRNDEDVTISPFLADLASDTAALAGGEIFAMGGAFQVLRRLPAGGDLHQPEQWEPVAVPSEVGARRFLGLWSPGPRRLVIVGSGGLVLAYDRGVWTVERTGVADDLRAVWGTEADGLFAVGAAGRLLHRGAGAWQVVPTGTTENLVSVHGQPGGRVVVLGAGGAVLEVVR